MSLTLSKMMELGTTAPAFTLPDTISGKELSLAGLKSDKATVVAFICNHCPYVHHINSKLVEVANAYQSRGVIFIAISSNDVTSHPQDSPALMTLTARKEGYSFPYLYDESQKVAKAYGAECTPDFFVFDGNMECAYRGRFDETRPNKGQPTGRDLSAALDAILTGKKVNADQQPSMGCNIKWR
ncbi:MAG: thioredoxin family protein [Cytophagales bacterium]|nr:thioredoxin family protein [Cytophagales bacterium]